MNKSENVIRKDSWGDHESLEIEQLLYCKYCKHNHIWDLTRTRSTLMFTSPFIFFHWVQKEPPYPTCPAVQVLLPKSLQLLLRLDLQRLDHQGSLLRVA
jgi:hypothetical protein